jgi:hypothetical protein
MEKIILCFLIVLCVFSGCNSSENNRSPFENQKSEDTVELQEEIPEDFREYKWEAHEPAGSIVANLYCEFLIHSRDSLVWLMDSLVDENDDLEIIRNMYELAYVLAEMQRFFNEKNPALITPDKEYNHKIKRIEYFLRKSPSLQNDNEGEKKHMQVVKYCLSFKNNLN